MQEGCHACGTGHLVCVIGARHCVAHLLRLARAASVDLPGAMLTYDTHITRAPEDCLTRLDPAKALIIEILFSNAATTSVQGFNDMMAGVQPNPPDTPGATCRFGDSFFLRRKHVILRFLKPLSLSSCNMISRPCLTKTDTTAFWRTVEPRFVDNATFSASPMCDIKPFHPSSSGLLSRGLC